MTASIIITTKDRSNLLTQRALKSALGQNYFDGYEIIVIDDAGTDNTPEVMEFYLKKHQNLSYVRLPENRGLSYARNYGIMRAKGEYIVCLDDDNELLPDFLTETIKEIGTFAAVGVGRTIKYKNFESYALPSIGKFTAIDWGWLIKKMVFDNIKYDEDLRANEDADFGIRFFKFFTAKVIDLPLAIAFDMDDPKQSLSFPNERELKGIEFFLKKNLHEYENESDELRYLYRLAGRKFYRGGFRLRGLGYFWKSFRAKIGLSSFLNLFFILFGWTIYDIFMTITERITAKKYRYKHYRGNDW